MCSGLNSGSAFNGVTLSELVKVYMPQFFHLQIGDDDDNMVGPQTAAMRVQ